MKKLFLLSIIFLGCLNQNKKPEALSYALTSDRGAEESLFKYYINYRGDSLEIIKEQYKAGDRIYRAKQDFIKKNNGYYLIENITGGNNNKSEKEIVLILSQSDTNFIHNINYQYEVPPPPGQKDLFYDFGIKINKLKLNLFVSSKYNLLDSQYYERLYYDSNYRINKVELNFDGAHHTLEK